MPKNSVSRRKHRLLTALLAVAASVIGLGGWGYAGAAASTPITDTGGSVLPHRSSAVTGALGVTFGFEDRTMAGGPYENQGATIYNYPMYTAKTATTDQFWLDYVEELVSAGVDFVGVDTRGFVPGSAVPNGGGDPRELTQLVNAITKAGAAGKLKIAAFDDVPASLTDKKNQVKHHTGGYTPPFDMADTTGAGEGGYQYLWDNDLKVFYQVVPDSMLYKVDGRPLVYLWGDGSMFINQGNGNSARMLQYVRSQAQSTFTENPYFIVDQAWLKNDPAVSSVADGEDDWFGVPSPTFTNQAFNGHTYGATAPSFSFVNSSHNMVIDPQHGKTLVDNLRSTVGAGDYITLVEGFSDWLEGAALWRTEAGSYNVTQRDYPNQNLNIMRRYSRTPFPTDLTVQAESADVVAGTTQGSPSGVYRSDLDVRTTTDTGSGWNVQNIVAGESEQWNEVPLQGTENLKVRVAAPASGARFQFVIDGVQGPVVAVPSTGGAQVWQTLDAGTFQFTPGTYHTVQIHYLTGGVSVNWWQAVSA
jgi:hypothetical protein